MLLFYLEEREVEGRGWSIKLFYIDDLLANNFLRIE